MKLAGIGGGIERGRNAEAAALSRGGGWRRRAAVWRLAHRRNGVKRGGAAAGGAAIAASYADGAIALSKQPSPQIWWLLLRTI